MYKPEYYSFDLPYEVWTEIQPLMEKFKPNIPDGRSIQDYHDDILSGELQLWVTRVDGEIRYIWMSAIHETPHRRWCEVVVSCGKMTEYVKLNWAWFERWLRGNKCFEVEAFAKPAVSRLLQRQGFEPTYQILVKKLEKY